MRPTKIVFGKQPLTSHEVVKQKSHKKYLATYRFAKDKIELFEQARDNLAKTTKCMKKYADQHKRDLKFKEGDKVMLKLIPQIWKKVMDKRYHKGLIQKYDGLLRW